MPSSVGGCLAAFHQHEFVLLLFEQCSMPHVEVSREVPADRFGGKLCRESGKLHFEVADDVGRRCTFEVEPFQSRLEDEQVDFC